MNWIDLQTDEQLNNIKLQSFKNPAVIFKHSTRCSISSVAKSRLERVAPSPLADFYLLDLIKYRSISNRIAEEFSIWHESPQVLIVKDGKCIYDESHSAISMNEINAQLN